MTNTEPYAFAISTGTRDPFFISEKLAEIAFFRRGVPWCDVIYRGIERPANKNEPERHLWENAVPNDG